MSVADSETRRFTLISGRGPQDGPPEREESLADVLTLQRPNVHPSSREAEKALYQDTLAEYCWARDVAGLAATTLNQLVSLFQPQVALAEGYDGLPPSGHEVAPAPSPLDIGQKLT